MRYRQEKLNAPSFRIAVGITALALLLAGGAGAALSPTVAPFDTDGNGIIDRAEAMNCVVQFFTGIPAPIPRATMIEVIVAYFSSAPGGTGSANGTVSRSFSTPTPPLSGTVIVTITPDTAVAGGLGYQVTETLPAGVAFISSTADNTNTSGLPNVVFTMVGATPFTYTVTMPDVAGTLTFAGTFRDGFGTGGGMVTGASTVSVGGGLSPPPFSGATGLVWDESLGSPLPYTWDHTNFEGFNVSGIGTETLRIVQTDLGAAAGKTRIIKDSNALPPAGGLAYTTITHLIQYEVSNNTGLPVDFALDGPLGIRKYYAKVNFFGEPYVGLKGKANKLTRLMLEQKGSEQKILGVGETWNMGDGCSLTANAIDGNAFPAQVWLVLSHNGQILDDKITTPGSVYTYVESNISGENLVPMFVTYVDNISTGANPSVALKYSWLISRNATVIQAGDTFGVLKAFSISDLELDFGNSQSINLAPNALINLAGNLKFKVIDDAAFLKFYPTIAPYTPVNSTITGTIANATSGAPIAGATVIAGSITAATDSAGVYSMSIPPGTYTVMAYAAGFVSNTTVITVTSGATATHNFVLQPRVLSLSVAMFDTNGNGIIDRPEAVNCINQFFFGGVVTRRTVVEVVVEYFSSPPNGTSSGIVTRTFSSPTVAPSGTLTVNITPDASLAGGLGYQVTETLPAGAVLISSIADNVTQAGQVITFTNFGGFPFTYTVTAPSASGTISFSGNFKDGFNSLGTVTGASEVNVVPTLPSLVAPFDTSGDGSIQRNEAVACVVRFFGGDVAVPRSTAVAVVVAFFSAPV